MTVVTHILWHTLDLYITKSNFNFLHSSPQKSTLLTDHFSITSQLNLSYKKYTPRFKIKNIDYISFKTDLYNSKLTTKHDPSSLTTTLSALLNKYAPLICSKIYIHTNSPWFNSELCSLKRHTRKLYRLYRKTPTHQNQSNFILACNSYRHNIFRTKSEFYQSKITAAGTNIKTLYKITDSLIGRIKQTQLPDMPDEILCNTFADLFTDKI